jgi:hypothetical protein
MCLNNVSFRIQKKLRRTNIHDLKPQTLDLKSRACFLSCLLLFKKEVTSANWKTLTFHMYVYFGSSSSSFRNIKFFVLSFYIELEHGYLLEEEKRLCWQNGTIGATRLLWTITYCFLLLLCNFLKLVAVGRYISTQKQCVFSYLIVKDVS